MSQRKPVADTKQRILDAAETLFAHHGYDGTSIRDIAGAGGVQIALVAYHFGPKSELFDHVIGRRVAVISARRLALLDDCRDRHGAEAIPLEAIIHAYVWPFLERSAKGGPGWKSYARLIALIANSRRWYPIIGKYYDPAARVFIAEFKRSLPDCPATAIYAGFSFLVGAMLTSCAETGRLENLSDGLCDSSDLESIFKDMLPFIRGGFESLRGG